VQSPDVRREGRAAELIYEYPLDHWHDVHGSRLKASDFVAAAFDLIGIYWRLQKIKAVPSSTVENPASDIRHRDAA
jgi:hypothetical protein